LISSARRIGVKTGPGWNRNSWAEGSQTERPMTSEGRVSGLNWILATLSPSALPRARASVVFPTPGTSSIRRCPRERRQTTASSTAAAGPR